VEIIKELDKGEKLINLAEEYGAGRAMIYGNPAVPWSCVYRITKIVLYYVVGLLLKECTDFLTVLHVA
jgi:hypothetical protein